MIELLVVSLGVVAHAFIAEALVHIPCRDTLVHSGHGSPDRRGEWRP
jgi:hypothetical protein